MRAAVITVKGREASLERLAKLIEPSVESLTVFCDLNRRGQFWNLSRCMEKMLSSAAAGEPVLIMTDDVITVPDWRERWEKIHAQAKNKIYTNFSRQRASFKPENLQRGFVTECNPRGFYDQSVIYIDQQDLNRRILSWFDQTGRQTIQPKRQKHYDVVIQEYLIAHNIPWTLSTPTLFEHTDVKSTLGHKVGASVNYIGNTL